MQGFGKKINQTTGGYLYYLIVKLRKYLNIIHYKTYYCDSIYLMLQTNIPYLPRIVFFLHNH